MVKELSEILNASAETEEASLPRGEFVSRICKAYKITMSIAAFAAVLIGVPMTFIFRAEPGVLFLALGIAMLLLLPTTLSYRCTVNKTSLKEEYLVLFIKIKKEVLWERVKYRRIKYGKTSWIKLYDSDKKHLISFDSSTVGFGRIVKMSKRGSIKDYKK